MKIVNPSIEILTTTDPATTLARLEAAGRTCYKSEGLITPDSAAAFVRRIIKSGHHSVLEHESISVRIICDRGVSHELVRHRLASFSQESTRYVNYKKRGLEFVKPLFYAKESPEYKIWCQMMLTAEMAYNALINIGSTPQEARTVLPNSLKTEIVMTANLREWRHILAQRCSAASHPQMREIMKMLLGAFTFNLPEAFEDLQSAL